MKLINDLKNKVTLYTLLTSTIIFFILTIILYITMTTDKKNNDYIVAKGKEHTVTLGESNFYLSQTTKQNTNFLDLNREQMKKIIGEILLRKEFFNKHKNLLKENPIAQANADLLISGIIQQLYIQTEINDYLSKESFLRKEYDKIVKELKGQKQYTNLKHILFTSEKEAKTILSDIAFNKFSHFASKYSTDEATKNKGGLIASVITEKQLDPSFLQEIKDLQPKIISNPIKTKFGWHIIVFDEQTEAKAVPFDKAKVALARSIVEKDINKKSQDFLNGEGATLQLLINPTNSKKEKEILSKTVK